MNNGKKTNQENESYVLYYSFGSQIIYKYGGLIVGFLMLFYLISGIIAALYNINHIFFVLFVLAVSFLFIKRYYEILKNLPFKISVDNKKIVCENYFFRLKKKVEIEYKDIDKLDGGIFDGRFLKPMRVYSSSKNIEFTFYNRLKNSDKLINMILKNVDKELYKKVLDNLSKRGIIFQSSKDFKAENLN